MDDSPFARFPRELQDIIWGMVLQQPQPVLLTFVPETTDGAPTEATRQSLRIDESNEPHLLALRRACRQTHKETAGVFLKSNTFAFAVHLLKGEYVQPHPQALEPEHIIKGLRQLLTRDPTTLKALKEITLDAGSWLYRDAPFIVPPEEATLDMGSPIRDIIHAEQQMNRIKRGVHFLRHNLRALRGNGIDVSVRLRVDYYVNLEAQSGSAHVLLPLFDREAHRTLAERTMRPYFREAAAAKKGGRSTVGEMGLRYRVLLGCQQRMEMLVKEIVEFDW